MKIAIVAAGFTASEADRLRRAAGFAPEALGYAISLDTATVNAFYWPHTKGVVFTRGYLSAGYAPAATRMIQAHEIGHAIQERDGTLAWRDEPYEGFVRRATAPVTLDAFHRVVRMPMPPLLLADRVVERPSFSP